MNTNSIQFYIVFLVTAGLLGGCADQTVDVSRPVSWGAANKVVQVDNLYFSGQPDERGLLAARDAGVDLVVNMRLPEEMNWDEAAAVRKLGMEYLNIPISGSGPAFDTATIEKLHELAEQNSHRKILMHCASGNRSSAWYALYLVERKGYWIEEALPIAEQTGLTKSALVTRMREYLSKP